MMMAADENDSKCDYERPFNTQRMKVPVSGWHDKNMLLYLFVLTLLMIMVTLVGIRNVELKYFL